MQMDRQQHGSTLFYSYAPSDHALCEQLARALRPLIREAHFSEWSAYHLSAGTDIAVEKQHALAKTTLVLLLLSSDYLASETCYQEMLDILERQKQDEIHVIPILLRPCDWLATPLAAYQLLPRNGRAITIWEKREQAFFALTQEIRQIVGLPQTPAHPRSTRAQQNRTELIKRVRNTWIEGLLEHSLHESTRLHLSIQNQPDALVNPWRMTVQELGHQTQGSLPESTDIVQAYDEADGELLLLGEPGAGKTTLLLSLARTLLDRAQNDPDDPIPVVFNLSSFASWLQDAPQKQELLSGWLINELQEKYHITRKVGKRWVEDHQLALLLDGLDEVAQEARDLCTRAIISYQQNQSIYAHVPLVVSCRSQEYAELPTHFPLNRAVSILPLTDTQIEQFFQQAGSQLEALHEALHTDAELAELARCPLMLNIFALTYQNATVADLPPKTASETTMSTIFSHYAEKMLARRGQLRTGSREQFLHRLIYLAQRMQRHNLTIFHPGEIELTWIYFSNSRQRWVTRLLFGFFISCWVLFVPTLLIALLFTIIIASIGEPGVLQILSLLVIPFLILALGILDAILIKGVIMNILPRFLLWKFGLFPWKARPLLDEAVERLLLRKAGYDYIFTHKRLQEYLAEQGKYLESAFFAP